ncbi:hypothetical protein FRUB_10329 [Fimbriiglobus ruber]|uniref:Uncharacterized protein n=1 Tax=Fimbriiglobus ruber TaxID=1908690 RepID=A0A225D732_9BACT|nr:hypothetical protein FRUB_10329 [Fimbriiglobus ruber]
MFIGGYVTAADVGTVCPMAVCPYRSKRPKGLVMVEAPVAMPAVVTAGHGLVCTKCNNREGDQTEMRKQTFRDGTVHLSVRCLDCRCAVGYAPNTPENLAAALPEIKSTKGPGLFEMIERLT